MKVIDAIQNRKSTREFSKKKPDWRDIIEAIHSAQYAPMAGGYFSLKFILVTDQDKIDKIAKWSEQEFIEQTQYVVAFITDPKITKLNYKEDSETYLRQQAGAAIQNFMLHLTSQKLSTCWIGYFNQDKIKTLLKILSWRVLSS